jgi:hypothetical protein
MHIVSGVHGQTCSRSPTPAPAASRQVKSLIRPSTDVIMHFDVLEALFKPLKTISQWINGCVACARQRRFSEPRTALSNLFSMQNRRHMFDIVERNVDMLLKQA